MLIEGLSNEELFPGVITKAASSSSDTDTAATEKSQAIDGKFEEVLTRMLSPNGQNEVSEEELFAAILGERVTTLKGDEAGTAFSEQLASQKEALKRPDGVVSVEDAARAALRGLVSDGVLTESEAATMHAQAFKAAQLDDNHEALFDNRGGPGDPTMAVAQMEAALLAARTMIEKIDSGEEVAGELGLDVGNTGLPNVRVTTLDDGTLSSDVALTGEILDGNPEDGPEGFLFKPVSESDGNLVVLLPHSLKDQIESLVLKTLDDTVVDEGRSTGYANGDREHFRFSKPGADYGSGIIVEARHHDGSVTRYNIADPSQRYD